MAGEQELDWETTNDLIRLLMQIDAKLDAVLELLEDEGGDAEETES